MSKQIFQNQNSISGISNIGNGNENLQQSIFQTQTTPNKSYKITINAPYTKMGQQNQTYSEQQYQIERSKRLITKNPFNQQNTGYDINRQLYSEEDIIEAFNIIDTNHDGILTADELSFFLKCIDQPHTIEEIQEMIKMVSKESTKVTVEDFKKVGKGKIIPFAGIRRPQSKSKQKQEILNNLKAVEITSMIPANFVNFKEQMEISYPKYQQQRARRELDVDKEAQQNLFNAKNILKMRSREQIQKKRQHFAKIILVNDQKIVEQLKNVKNQFIEIRDLSEILGITELMTRELFEQNKKISTKKAMVDSILFGQIKSLRKLQLILSIAVNEKVLNLAQWIKILTYMMSTSQAEFIKKRLQNILKHKKISLKGQFDKYFIYQIMSQNYSLFNW